MEFRIKIKNLDKLERAIRNYPERSAVELRRAIGRSLSYVERRAKIKTPVDRGGLRSSYRQRIVGLRGELWPRKKYAPFVEFGTRPHTPPLKAIKRWAKRKNLPAGAIWMAIRRRGTKPHPYFEPAIKESEDKVKQFFEKAFNKLLKNFEIK